MGRALVEPRRWALAHFARFQQDRPLVPVAGWSESYIAGNIVRFLGFGTRRLASTALRGSVERFLTGEEISALNPTGTRRSLHQRIQLWEDRTGNHRVAELLRAVKWIRNEGTHEGIPLTAPLPADAFRRS